MKRLSLQSMIKSLLSLPRDVAEADTKPRLTATTAQIHKWKPVVASRGWSGASTAQAVPACQRVQPARSVFTILLFLQQFS